MRRSRAWTLAILLVAVGSVPIGAGCGSDDDAGGGGQSAADATSSDAPKQEVPSGTDKEQIAAIVQGIQDDFNRADGAAFCDKVVKAEQEEIVAFGRNWNKGSNCADVMSTTARQTNESGVKQKPTKFISAQVNGRRGRARVSNGGRPPEWMVFVKEDGEWKLVESGIEPDPIAAAEEQAKNKKN
jgi:hypothetical protein